MHEVSLAKTSKFAGMSKQLLRTSSGETIGATEADQLPRLVYVGDVPVESTYHGSALLYRLFQDYPPDKLLVVEAGPGRSAAARRVQNVLYRQLSMGATRLRNTR